MKHKPLKIGTAILVCAMLFGAFTLSLVSYSDGNDPLVTLSYLTDIILPQMKKDILMEVAKTDSSGENNPETPDEPDEPDTPAEPNETPFAGYTLLELENGAKLFADSPLEFIVRPGSDVQVISPFDAQGIADVSNGTEYLNGDSVQINAYCVIPRGGDGRGIEVTNEKSYILVRGEYNIG